MPDHPQAKGCSARWGEAGQDANPRPRGYEVHRPYSVDVRLDLRLNDVSTEDTGIFNVYYPWDVTERGRTGPVVRVGVQLRAGTHHPTGWPVGLLPQAPLTFPEIKERQPPQPPLPVAGPVVRAT